MLTRCKNLQPQEMRKIRKKKVDSDATEVMESGQKRELLSNKSLKKSLKVILELSSLLKLKFKIRLHGHGREDVF